MISRTSGILLTSYILVFLGGIGYLVAPSPTIEGVAQHAEALIWGLFYALGGLIAAVMTGLRPLLRTKITPLWYFETAGVSLVISANLVHIYALYEVTMMTGSINLLALSGILLAYSLALAARVGEVISMARYLGQFAITPQVQE